MGVQRARRVLAAHGSAVEGDAPGCEGKNESDHDYRHDMRMAEVRRLAGQEEVVVRNVALVMEAAAVVVLRPVNDVPRWARDPGRSIAAPWARSNICGEPREGEEEVVVAGLAVVGLMLEKAMVWGFEETGALVHWSRGLSPRVGGSIHGVEVEVEVEVSGSSTFGYCICDTAIEGLRRKWTFSLNLPSLPLSAQCEVHGLYAQFRWRPSPQHAMAFRRGCH